MKNSARLAHRLKHRLARALVCKQSPARPARPEAVDPGDHAIKVLKELSARQRPALRSSFEGFAMPRRANTLRLIHPIPTPPKRPPVNINADGGDRLMKGRAIQSLAGFPLACRLAYVPRASEYRFQEGRLEIVRGDDRRMKIGVLPDPRLPQWHREQRVKQERKSAPPSRAGSAGRRKKILSYKNQIG